MLLLAGGQIFFINTYLACDHFSLSTLGSHPQLCSCSLRFANQDLFILWDLHRHTHIQKINHHQQEIHLLDSVLSKMNENQKHLSLDAPLSHMHMYIAFCVCIPSWMGNHAYKSCNTCDSPTVGFRHIENILQKKEPTDGKVSANHSLFPTSLSLAISITYSNSSVI